MAGVPPKRGTPIWAWLLALFVGAPFSWAFVALPETAFLSALMQGAKDAKASSDSESSVESTAHEERPAEPRECIVSIPGSDARVPGFPTEAGYEEWRSAAANGTDEQGLWVVVRSNSGILVESGTRCAFVERGFLSSRVRITEPPFTGRSVWLPNEWTRGK